MLAGTVYAARFCQTPATGQGPIPQACIPAADPKAEALAIIGHLQERVASLRSQYRELTGKTMPGVLNSPDDAGFFALGGIESQLRALESAMRRGDDRSVLKRTSAEGHLGALTQQVTALKEAIASLTHQQSPPKDPHIKMAKDLGDLEVRLADLSKKME